MWDIICLLLGVYAIWMTIDYYLMVKKYRQTKVHIKHLKEQSYMEQHRCTTLYGRLAVIKHMSKGTLGVGTYRTTEPDARERLAKIQKECAGGFLENFKYVGHFNHLGEAASFIHDNLHRRQNPYIICDYSWDGTCYHVIHDAPPEENREEVV